MDAGKAIRVAMMVAKSLEPVTSKPLFKAGGGEVEGDEPSGIPQGRAQQRMAGNLAVGPQPTSIVKEKGGQWLTGSVDPMLGSLQTKRVPTYLGTTEAPEVAMYLANRGLENLHKHEEPDRAVRAEQLTNTLQQATRHKAVNDWVDSTLKKYVMRDMATEHDPVRALAERGILHVDPEQLNYKPEYHGQALREGQRHVAKSDEAKAWEGVTDNVIDKDIVKNMPPADRRANPWLNKTDPDTFVHFMHGHSGIHKDLGFDHLVDELHNSLRHDSDLPQNLRLRPESMQRMSVPQAVEHVHKINQWRADNVAEADRKKAFNPATFLHKDYPNSDLAWYEIKNPDNAEQVHQTPNGATFTEEEMNDPLVRAVVDKIGSVPVSTGADKVREALKYEGDAMGHCVGGYADNVLNGNTRIFSLRNKKTGAPHVTIEADEYVRPEANPGYYYNSDRPSQELIDKMSAAENAGELDHDRNAWKDIVTSSDEYKKFLKENTVKHISQIKGKQNAKPISKYIPYVQDFVKSDDWNRIDDFHNTDLVDWEKLSGKHQLHYINNAPRYEAVTRKMYNRGQMPSRYMTEDEFHNPESWLKPDPWEQQDVPHKADGGEVSDEPQRQITDQGLYSAAANAARNLKQEAGSPARMLNLLRGSSGVKKEEIQNANPEAAFAGRDRITREELAKHFEDSLPNVQEETRARWKQYSTPGSEDYREKILSLPTSAVKGEYENTTHWPGIKNPLVHLRMGDRPEPSASTKPRGPMPPKSNRTVSVSRTRYGETEKKREDVPGWSTPTPGLVINKSSPADDWQFPWTLTHEGTGLRVTSGHTYWGMHKMAKLLGDHTDWTQPGDAITGFYKKPENADYNQDLQSLIKAARTTPTGDPLDFHSPEPWQLAGRKTRKPSIKTVVDGPKKHLLLDELQSDWGQAGRDRGFGENLSDDEYYRLAREAEERRRLALTPIQKFHNEEKEKLRDKRAADWDRIDKEYQSKVDSIYNEHLSTDDPEKHKKIYDKKKEAANAHRLAMDAVNQEFTMKNKDLSNQLERDSLEHNVRHRRELEELEKKRGRIPSAPWVTDTKGWVDLGLKRALWEAARGGHDNLVWTPGSVQAKRYPEIRHVADMVSYHPESKEFTAWKNGRSVHSEDNASPQRISTLIGKGPAEQLLATEKSASGHHNLMTSNISIAPREAGMKSFYEGMIPERLKSIMKAHGVVPEISPLKSKDKKILGWPSMRITPEMRESILKNGFPAFKRGGEVEAAPVNVDPQKAIRKALMVAKASGVL